MMPFAAVLGPALAFVLAGVDDTAASSPPAATFAALGDDAVQDSSSWARPGRSSCASE
jgi:hypothetical protein